MIKHLGLRFGAFDFVLDHSMNYWFLEVNPNGQWAFIERETGIPISKAIADLFKSA
jgi:glutathione synthase/RimK-type ligase-like ATP-grasp enzyme